MEIKSFDQTDDKLNHLISKFQAPNYICGQFSCANAWYLSKEYPEEEMNAQSINKMLLDLQDYNWIEKK